MNRQPPALTLPAADVEVVPWTSPWVRLVPLWRHAVWLVVFFGICAFAVSIRVDVASLNKDLARNARLKREAVVLHERLELEWSVRRRTAAVEALAAGLGLAEEVPLVQVTP